jgi:hypothetical protein
VIQPVSGYQLNELHINVIFQLKNNIKQISMMKKKNDIVTFIEYSKIKIKFRIIRYTINKKVYYLGTTIYNQNIEYFKNLYWKRWSCKKSL